MFDAINEIKEWAVEQVLWAERNLHGKTGAEKKAAVIKKLDDMIELPPYLEWADDMVLSWLVDAVCNKINAAVGHDFENKHVDEEKISEAVEIPEGLVKTKED